MNIGERIRGLREKQEMTQTELAEKIGSTKQTVYKYENGVVTNIPYDKLILLAKALGTTPSSLMGWEKESDKSKLSVRDERDIKNDLESLKEKLSNKELGPAAFDGEDIPDDDVDLFLGQVELMLRRLKIKNKEKYNPNKNKE